jgi:hypothetical protein
VSRLEDELLALIEKYDQERQVRERTLAKKLLAIYEECRKELYLHFIEAQATRDKLRLEYLESVLREIEKQMQYYTGLTAQVRQDFIDNAFLLGQRFGADALAAGGIELGAQAGFGVINRGMVEALIGDIPRLAGRVQEHVLFRLRDELTRGAVMGESMPKVARRVLGTGITQEGLKKPFPSIQERTLTIARTEIIKSSDAGYEDLAVQAQKAVGEEIYDAWITAGDDRVSAACRAIAAGSDLLFKSLSGYPGVYRRDGGPRPVISTHPRCRCRRVPFLLSWAESGALRLKELRKRADNPKGRATEKPREGLGIISFRNSFIPEDKFTKFALDRTHLKGGRDKAIAFDQALGYNQSNYQHLVENIRSNLKRYPAKHRGKSEHGDRYEVIMDLTGPNGKTAKVLTGWLVDKNGKARLVTAHVDKRKRNQ